MNYFVIFTFLAEMIGCVSFSISGAVTAIKNKMDLFGVLILGMTTAVGGGIIRDLILGITPPKTFTNPVYVIVAVATAFLTFWVEAAHRAPKTSVSYDLLLFWMDTIGLAIFTVVGISTAYEKSDSFSAYLLIFVGVLTGVGGGVLRDIFAGHRPYIFVKHIYACASILGSLACVVLWRPLGRIPAMITGAAVILALRCFARHYKWNLPHVAEDSLTGQAEGPTEGPTGEKAKGQAARQAGRKKRKNALGSAR